MEKPKAEFDFSKKEDQEQFNKLPDKAKEVLINESEREAIIENESSEKIKSLKRKRRQKKPPKPQDQNQTAMIIPNRLSDLLVSFTNQDFYPQPTS